MEKPTRFSEAEWRVLKLLWRRAPQTAQELWLGLKPETGWALSTVKTVLSRLVAKGALRTETQAKAFLFTPTVNKAESQGAEAKSFLDRVFDGAVSPLMAHFVQAHRLSDQQIDELEALLKKRKQKDRK